MSNGYFMSQTLSSVPYKSTFALPFQPTYKMSYYFHYTDKATKDPERLSVLLKVRQFTRVRAGD